jgi:hypothetical protein
MRYDTKEKRIKTLKKVGNIITFKTPIIWKGDPFSQILISEFIESKNKVKIIGFGRDTKWYENIDELIDSVDWEWMEKNHGDELDRIF